MARQRAADRRRRRRSATVWVLRILLPVLGAAAALALLQVNGDLSDLSPAAAVAVPAAVLLIPALASALLARVDGLADAVLWLLVTLAGELALAFGVGLDLLGLGPG
jgi:hypothetical protein